MRWPQFFYYYVIVLSVFVLGLRLVIKSKNLNLKTAYGKKYLLILCGGLLFFILLQGFMQFVAPNL